MIQELFGGKVSEFIKYDTLVLGNDLTAILHRLFNRLSDLEKKVMYRVASEESPVSISQLLEDLTLSGLAYTEILQTELDFGKFPKPNSRYGRQTPSTQ